MSGTQKDTHSPHKIDLVIEIIPRLSFFCLSSLFFLLRTYVVFSWFFFFLFYWFLHPEVLFSFFYRCSVFFFFILFFCPKVFSWLFRTEFCCRNYYHLYCLKNLGIATETRYLKEYQKINLSALQAKKKIKFHRVNF